MAGGEVSSQSRAAMRRPVRELTMPLSPKSAQGLPLEASMAISRALMLAMNTRRWPHDDAARRRPDIEAAVDVEARRFERCWPPMLVLVCIAGAECPGNLERLYVLAIDGCERRKTLAARIVAIGRPFAFRLVFRANRHDGE
jgi:hypothetical protein